MKHLLMIAYHFPPLVGSSGMQRTLRFAEHLPAHGWQPIILAPHPRAYEQTVATASPLPASTPIVRAQAWDCARHLSIFGRYPRFLALPDRWSSWRWDGVRQGMKLIERFKPAALWSTFPIASAHLIGERLAARSGLPWIADFRDPMAQPDYPDDVAQRESFHRLEARVIARAAQSVFVSPGAIDLARQNHPDSAGKMTLIENGYEDAMLATGEPLPALNPGCLTLLHSGIVYPSERDPRPLFEALAHLKAADPALCARLRLRFRGAVHEGMLRALAQSHGVSDLVQIAPMCPYPEAVAEMRAADALVVLQASNCNTQIPAKFYEYLACRRPILMLTDPSGDTARAARAAGIDALAPLSEASSIADLLRRFLSDPAGMAQAPDDAVRGAARSERTRALAQLLDAVTAPDAPARGR